MCHINIHNNLLAEVQKISGEKSKTKAITTAMQEFIKQKKINELIVLTRLTADSTYLSTI